MKTVPLGNIKAMKDKQAAFRASQVNTKTKKAKQHANHVLRIPFQKTKRERQHVIPVPQVAPLPQEVLYVPLAPQVDMCSNLRTHVWNVQQVECRKTQTVKYVTSVAQAAKEKAAKQENPPAHPAI